MTVDVNLLLIKPKPEGLFCKSYLGDKHEKKNLSFTSRRFRGTLRLINPPRGWGTIEHNYERKVTEGVTDLNLSCSIRGSTYSEVDHLFKTFESLIVYVRNKTLTSQNTFLYIESKLLMKFC